MKHRTMLRHVGWSLLAQVLTLGFGLLTSLAAARILGPEDRGRFAVATLFALLVATTGTLGIPAAVAYFGSRWISSPLRAASLLALSSVVGIAVLGALATSAWLPDPGSTAWVSCVLAVASAAAWLVSNRAVASLAWRRYALSVGAGRMFALVATVVLAYGFDLGVDGCLIALVGAEVVIIALLGMRTRRQFDAGDARPTASLRMVVSYGLRTLPGTLSQFLVLRLDVFLVAALVSFRAAGVYAVAQTFSEALLAVARATQTAIVPFGARESEGRYQPGTLRSLLAGYARLSGVVSLLTAVIAPLLILVALGDDFRASVPLLLILIPGAWFLGMGLVAASTLRSLGRPGAGSIPMVVGLPAIVLLDLAFVPAGGALGAAIVSSVVYIGVGAGTVLVVRGYLKTGGSLKPASTP